MKPSIERELEAIRQMVRDLEARLKNERAELGHRATFDIGKRGEVPPPTLSDRVANKVLGTTGWVAQSGGSGSGLSTVYTDGTTVGGDGSSTYPISASLLSATLDARIKNLSGSIDGRFNSLDYLSAVSHNSTLSGDGTAGSPLSAAPTFVAAQTAITSSIAGLSGTIDAALVAISKANQTWVHTANGTEGTTLTAIIPLPFAGPQYQVFVTNFTGSNSPVFKVQNKTSASFQIVSTAPFSSGDKLDLLAVSGSYGPLADVSPYGVLSGTVDSAIKALSGTIHAEVMFEGASVWQTGSQTVRTGGSGTLLVFDNVEFDRGSFFSPSFRTRLTSPSDGFYLLMANVQFSANATGFRELSVRKNANGDPALGTTVTTNKRMAVTTAANVTYVEFSVATFLSASDYVELFSFQNSGATLLHGSAVYLNFQITKLGY